MDDYVQEATNAQTYQGARKDQYSRNCEIFRKQHVVVLEKRPWAAWIENKSDYLAELEDREIHGDYHAADNGAQEYDDDGF